MRLRLLFYGLLLWMLATTAALAEPSVRVRALSAAPPEVTLPRLLSGAFDERFEEFHYRRLRARGEPFWLRVAIGTGAAVDQQLALVVEKGRHLQLSVYPASVASSPHKALPPLAMLPAFRGVHEVAYAVPVNGSGIYYVQVRPQGSGAERLRLSAEPAVDLIARGAERTRAIAAAFGAIAAMAFAALVIFFVLPDRLFILYAGLFALQALYVAYISGEGFDWPVLMHAAPLGAHAWNVPVALSGAIACLFVREITDLRRYGRRLYAAFGWLALAFVVLAVANFGEYLGVAGAVAQIGNLMFLGAAIFTLAVAFIAWRRGSRAAGWFLLAWGLLETLTIATSISFLLAEDVPLLLHYGLPWSMVVAAVLVALGLADRLREQRLALSDAERRARTDPLTGVLNRRSLLERLEAACSRAKARGLPIALLFIDLDHFKSINDTFGHLAGDACLRAVIAPIQSELRQSDVIGRYGGEEFVVILSSADEAAARSIAQRILQRVAGLRVDGFGAPIQLTCSIGVAASDVVQLWGEELIASADAALYAAKHAGRNQVRVALPMVQTA